MNIPTRTDKTKKRYMKEANRIVRKYMRETGVQNNINIQDFVNWVQTSMADKSKATCRQYKAALRYYLEINKKLNLIEQINDIDCSNCKKANSSTRTSSSKAKSVASKDIDKIRGLLVARGTQIAMDTYIWIIVTLLTGLRPSEWQYAEFIAASESDSNVNMLRVRNGKDSNGRTHGEMRTLVLDNMDEQYVNLIKSFVSRVKVIINSDDPAKSYDNFYEKCRHQLYSATKTLFPNRKKRPTLYTFRHQFCANLKNAGYSLIEIATLMGHGTDETATKHYGRRSRKRGASVAPKTNLPRAVSEEMSRVKEVFVSKLRKAPHQHIRQRRSFGL